MPYFTRWSEADLRIAEDQVRRGEKLIDAQERRIDALELEGRDTFDARSTLGLMEQMQLQHVHHCERIADALNAPHPFAT